MEKDWRDIWPQRIMWLCWFLVLIWLIAKTFGYINTPLWLEYFPYYGAIAGIAMFFLQSGKFLEKFDHMHKDVEVLKSEMKNMKKEIVNVDKRLSAIEN